MRKLFLTLAALLLLTGLSAQNDNVSVFDEKSGKDILLGTVTREGLISMGDWYETGYQHYQPDATILDSLKQFRNDYPWVMIVLATWCSDSREQVPHFLKMLDMLNYPREQIFMVAVDRNKKAGNFCVGDFNVTLVPTFIFSSEGEETGRIVETPATTLEKDFLKILRLKNSLLNK